MNDISKLIPRLNPAAKLQTDEGDTFITLSECLSPVNQQGIDIIQCINGERTIADISQLMHAKEEYAGFSKKTIVNGVQSFLATLWSKGIYLERNMDKEMCEALYSGDQCVYFPSFASLPLLQLSYISPVFDPMCSGTPEGLLELLRTRIPVSSIGFLNKSGGYDSLVMLSRTNSFCTYQILAVFGRDIDLSDLERSKSILPHKREGKETYLQAEFVIIETQNVNDFANLGSKRLGTLREGLAAGDDLAILSILV